jgi:hypothetical protein
VTDPDVHEKIVAPLAVKLKTTAAMFDCNEKKIRRLIDAHELDSYLDDGVRMVTMASIHRRFAKLMEANKINTECAVAATKVSLAKAREQRQQLRKRELNQAASQPNTAAGRHPRRPVAQAQTPK